MKTRFFTLIACLLLIATCGFAKSKVIEGNGKLITKEIAIKDYDAISALGGAVIEYEQSTASPYLSVTVDENILPLLEIKMKGKTLSISYKEKDRDDKYETTIINGRKTYVNNGYSISPTRYVIKTNSQTLKDINLVGGCRMTIESDFKADKLSANIAGSGNIDFSQSTDLHKGDFSVAGSGEINLRKFAATNLNCSVAGSGEIKLNGKADRGNFSVAGGGDIYGFNCELRKGESSVAGGGNIEIYATDQLDSSVAGGGKIRYKGNVAVNKSIVAGGSIKKVDE